jgi:dolichol-phosphate mannosyltransferase
VILYLLTSPTQRRWLLKPQPYLAAGLAVLVFAPVLYWNSQHEWISLAFQSSRRVDQMSGFKPRYFLLLVGTQFLMMTPYLFVIAIAALVRGGRRWPALQSDDRTRLLLINGAVPIVLFVLISFRSIIKINWLAPAFWSLVIVGLYQLLASEQGFRKLARGLASSAALLLACGIAVAIPNLPVVDDMNSWSGWKEAAARVARVQQSERAAGRASFVFSPNYKISSLLRFYLPGQPRTYAQDVYGKKALQYDYFPLDEDLKGATGILVVSDQRQSKLDLDLLKPYFDACELEDTVEASALGKVTRRMEIFRCPNYAGHPPRAASQGEQPD